MANTLMSGFKVFKGTKAQFIEKNLQTTHANSIVYITGGSNAKDSCIFAQGTYFGDITALMKAISYVKGISVGGQLYNVSEGGGYIGFSAKTPSQLSVTTDNNGVEISLTDEFINKVNTTATNLGTADDATTDNTAFGKIANLASLINDIKGDGEGSISDQITNAINALRTEIAGTLGEDDAKTLEAINDELNSINVELAKKANSADVYTKGEADSAINTAKEAAISASAVTMSTASTTSGMLKTYTFTQNGATVATIDIPKDLVVQSGELSKEGDVTYLVLTIANQTDPIKIPVTDLIDVYEGGANITIEGKTISVTGLGSAAYTESSAYATAAQGAKADTAVQSVTTGTANGTISVDGADVNVYGLKSAAYTESSAYATAAQGTKADNALQSITSASTSYATVNTKSDNTQAITIVTKNVADATSTSTGVADAYQTKAYVDSLWEWEEIGI